MMKKLNLPLVILMAIAAVSCQDVIDIDIDEGETRVVINGRITGYTSHLCGGFGNRKLS
jgi:hypothetical protein